MDGSYAVLTLVLGLWDMFANYCQSECLARRDTGSYYSVSAGSLWRREQQIGNELYFRADTGRMYGPFELTFGASLSSLNDFWAGAGVIYDVPLGLNAGFVKLHAMGGIYDATDGPVLGGPIEFRSGIEAGFEAQNGWRYALSFDHRSSAGLYPDSSGVETLLMRLSVPF